MNDFMKIALEKSIQGFKNKDGGPFGAVIIDENGKIVAKSNNKD